MDVTLTIELREFVRRKVQSGDFPTEEAVLQEALRRFCREDQRGTDTGLGSESKAAVDHEAIAYCTRELEGREIPSVEEVRRMLSKIPGSMSQAVIEEREYRS